MTLRAPELQRLRADANRWLSDTCRVERPDPSTDDTGGKQPTWTLIAVDGTPIRLAPPTRAPGATTVGERISTTELLTATLPASVAVQEGDRITMADGRRYDVIGSDTDNTIDVTRRVEIVSAP